MTINEVYEEWKKRPTNKLMPVGGMLRMAGIQRSITVKRDNYYVIEFYQNKRNVPEMFPYFIRVIRADSNDEASRKANQMLIEYLDEHGVAAKLAPYIYPYDKVVQNYKNAMKKK